MSKLLNFSILLIVLTIFDFVTTTYAIVNKLGSEANGIMAPLVNNLLLFAFVKAVGILWIIGMYRWIQEKSEKIASIGQMIILLMMMVVVGNNVMIISANAATIPFNSPGSLYQSYFSGYDIVVGNGSTSTKQNVSQYVFTPDGYLGSSQLAVYNGTGYISTVMMSRVACLTCNNTYPNTPLPVTFIIRGGALYRTVGTVAADMFYLSYDPITQPAGNQNIDAVLTSNFRVPLTESSAGILYYMSANDAIRTSAYGLHYAIRSDGSPVYERPYYTYSPNNFHILAAGDVNASDLTGAKILDMEMDFSGNLQVLIGSSSGSHNLSRAVFDGTTGSLLRMDPGLRRESSSSGFVYSGAILPDAINPEQNFTYVYITSLGISKLMHNSSNGTVDMYGGSLGYTYPTALDMLYANGVYYVSNSVDNQINTYYDPRFRGQEWGTNFSTQQADLIYTKKNIYSVYDTYYNNSKIQINFEIAYTADVVQKDVYSHRIDILAPSGVTISSFPTIRGCEDEGIFDWLLDPDRQYNCIAVSKPIDIIDYIANPAAVLASAGSISFSPSTFWPAGNYSAKLYELPSVTLLASDTFSVLNQSGTLTSATGNNPGQNPNQPIAGTDIINLLQNNTFWALILTIGMMIGIGIMSASGGNNPAIPMIMAGFLGMAVTAFLGWMPLWIVFGTVLIVIVAFAWKYAGNSNTGSQ